MDFGIAISAQSHRPDYMKTAEDGARLDFAVADISTPCDVGSMLEGCVGERVACVTGGCALSAAATTTNKHSFRSAGHGPLE